MKRTLLLLFSAALVYATMTSYSAGPSGTPAGVNTAKNGCGGGGCHTGPVNPIDLKLKLVKTGDTGATTGKYSPNATYRLTLTFKYAGKTKYGYILMASHSTNTQAGTFSNPLSHPGVKLTTKTPYVVVEQPSSITPGANGMEVTFDWTAPAKGGGTVTFNYAANATNGNGSADTADKFAYGLASFTEGWALDVEDINQQISVSTYPNPATNVLNIDAGNTSANYSYAVFNMSGAITAKGNFSGKTSVDVSSLAPGMHFVKITEGANQKTIIFNKL